jgi:hypothetical protein
MQLVLWCEIKDTGKIASSGIMGLMACQDTPLLTKLGRYEFSEHPMDSMHLHAANRYQTSRALLFLRLSHNFIRFNRHDRRSITFIPSDPLLSGRVLSEDAGIARSVTHANRINIGSLKFTHIFVQIYILFDYRLCALLYVLPICFYIPYVRPQARSFDYPYQCSSASFSERPVFSSHQLGLISSWILYSYAFVVLPYFEQ